MTALDKYNIEDMFNKQYLKFEVLSKPSKDLYKTVQANAKFKSLAQVIGTKVGINNFYNFSIAIKSTILMRDVVLNSQWVSGWARSSQVLNSTDSKFSGYKFLSRDSKETEAWTHMMEQLERQGHSMDNMRALIWLDSMTDYAVSIDILHLVELAIVLDKLHANLDAAHDDFKDEVGFFLCNVNELLFHEYGIFYGDFEQQLLNDALRDFPATNSGKCISLKDITCEQVYNVSATYSVIGQIWRHRTLVKTYASKTYSELVAASKVQTSAYDYSTVGMHPDIAEGIVAMTNAAKSAYGLCQGSIVPFEFTGTVGAVYKALCQRTCFINDSPQFKDAFQLFKDQHPDMLLLPPCKLNTTSTNACYVGYVNESRRRGEEKTQVVCPVYAKSKGYDEDFRKSIAAPKTQWYIKNLDLWEYVCK